MTLRTRQNKVRNVDALQSHHRNGMRSSTQSIRRMVEGECHVGTQSNATHARHLSGCVTRLYKDIAKWETKRNTVNRAKRAKLRELIFKFNLYADLAIRLKEEGFEDMQAAQVSFNEMHIASYSDNPVEKS